MKTKLLWALMLSVGSTALYFGIVRPEVSTLPKRVQEFVAKDPATQPPVRLPPLVVSESRLPAIPAEAPEPSPRSPDVPTRVPSSTDSATEAPAGNIPDENAALKTTAEAAGEARVEIKK